MLIGNRHVIHGIQQWSPRTYSKLYILAKWALTTCSFTIFNLASQWNVYCSELRTYGAQLHVRNGTNFIFHAPNHFNKKLFWLYSLYCRYQSTFDLKNPSVSELHKIWKRQPAHPVSWFVFMTFSSHILALNSPAQQFLSVIHRKYFHIKSK